MIWRIATSPNISSSYNEICNDWCFDDLIQAHLALNAIDAMILEQAKENQTNG
jgi:hypothetical protein